MNTSNNIINSIPNWIASIAIALVISYTTIQIKTATTETRCSSIEKQIEILNSNKADKILLDETVKRLDRIENKLDKALSK